MSEKLSQRRQEIYSENNFLNRKIPFTTFDYSNLKYNKKTEQWEGTEKETKRTFQYNKQHQRFEFI